MARKAAAGSKPAKGAGKKKGAQSDGDNVVPLKGGAMPAASPAKLGGSNGGDVSPETFMRNVGLITKAKDAVEKATAAYRNARKKAKDDGCVLAEVDQVVREAAMDPEELRQKHNRLVTYRRYIGLPIGTQLSLLDPDGGEITEEKIVARAESEGKLAASRGEFASVNPHDLNGIAGRAWAKGWDDQQALMRGALGQGQTNADKERARQNSADF